MAAIMVRLNVTFMRWLENEDRATAYCRLFRSIVSLYRNCTKHNNVEGHEGKTITVTSHEVYGASHNRSFVCLFNSLLRLTSKETSKLCHWAFVRESIGDRWIPLTKGQERGKRFQFMTSSWLKPDSYESHLHCPRGRAKGCLAWFI